MKRKDIYEHIGFYQKEVERLEYELGLEQDDVSRMRRRIDLMTAREKLHEHVNMLKEEELSSKLKRGCKKAWELFLRFLV